MTKNDFRKLFMQALADAAESAEARSGKAIPRAFVIELHGPASSRPGGTMSVDEAIDRVYLGDDLFYKVIDVAIRGVLPEKAIAFVRVSGHAPVRFGKTFNPSDLGPFKRILAENIEDRSARGP